MPVTRVGRRGCHDPLISVLTFSSRLRMPFRELVLKRVQTSEEDSGCIVEDGDRIITFRAKTFQAIVEKLNGLTGRIVAKELLYQLGNQIGRTGLEYSKARVLDNGENLVQILDSVLRFRGWGRCLAIDPTDNGYRVTIQNCAFCHMQQLSEPSCHLMLGSVTGWIEAFLGVRASGRIESECVATGGKFCVFEMTFPQEA